MALQKNFTRKQSTMRACVTGATGFVGKRLVQKLLSQGFQVRILTRNKEVSFPSEVEVINADLTSSSLELSGLLSETDFIFNCAGELKDSKLMRRVHVDAIKTLIQVAQEEILLTGRQIHWIQLGSIGVYGKSSIAGDAREINEISQTNASNEYESSKLESDKILIESNDSFFSYSILRPSAIVGNGMLNKSFADLLSAIKNGFFFYVGTLDSICNYVHVDDVVDALILCAVDKRAKNQIFNLSNDCKLYTIVERISGLKGKAPNFFCVPEKPLRFLVKLLSKMVNFPLDSNRIDVLISKTTYSNKKLQDFLGYTPRRAIPDFAVEYVDLINTHAN